MIIEYYDMFAGMGREVEAGLGCGVDDYEVGVGRSANARLGHGLGDSRAISVGADKSNRGGAQGEGDTEYHAAVVVAAQALVGIVAVGLPEHFSYEVKGKGRMYAETAPVTPTHERGFQFQNKRHRRASTKSPARMSM